MNRAITGSKIYYRLCCFAMLYIAASASFYGFYSKYHFAEADSNPRYGGGPRASFEHLVEGTANRPFVYRQLLPTTANWIDSLTPQSIKTWWFTPLRPKNMSPAETFIDSPIAKNPVYYFRYLIVYFGNFAFALIAVYAMYFACKSLGLDSAVSMLTAVIFMLLFPYIESKGATLYDFGELAFTAVALWFAIRLDWWWLIPVTALAAWNKESFFFFVLALYPFLRLRSSRLGALLQTALLSVICLAVYYQGHLRFAHNPGGTVEVHWRNQIDFFLHPRNWLFGRWPFERTYGILMVPALTVLPMALLVWTVLHAWPLMSPAMKRHAQIAAAINIPLYLMFCWPGEFRNFSLMNMSFVLVLATNLRSWVRGYDTPLAPIVHQKTSEIEAYRDLVTS
jgi:hypothetical protein